MMFWVENDCQEIRYKLPTEKIPEEKYRFILDNMPICCVDVVIECGEKFLVCKRKDQPVMGWWWFPGGRLLKGEDILQCARRKANEEAGIPKSETLNMFKVDVFETIFDSGPLGAKSHTVNITYHLLITKEDDVKISEQDFSDYRWVKGNEDFLSDYIKHVIAVVVNES